MKKWVLCLVYAVSCVSTWGGNDCWSDTLGVVSLDDDWLLSFRRFGSEDSWRTISASVPGEVNLDLVRAELIPNPMCGTNVYAHLDLEVNEWRYERRFRRVESTSDERLVLRFDGVDTDARYYLNGEFLGASANMFVPVEFDVTERLRDENVLRVDILPVASSKPTGVLGGWRQRAGSDGDLVRKAQHSFGWDIMPRLVTFGIWKGVRIERRPKVRVSDLYFFTMRADAARRTAEVGLKSDVEAPVAYLHRAIYRITLNRSGRTVATVVRPLHSLHTQDRFIVEDVDFWWPREAGDPALYIVKFDLLDPDGRVVASSERTVGIRTIELERRDWKSESDPGIFRFLVNGEPIYMHGCNVTPMDACHSRDSLHLKRCCEMLVDLNCNMVRSWGGGVYESDEFFDFCDANGILVWQDFCLANAYPSQSDEFALTIRNEALAVVRRLRIHPSLAIWCGNNEIDRNVGGTWMQHAPDPATERISRHVLPNVLRELDPLTPYLPSSPIWTRDTVTALAGSDTQGVAAPLSQDHLWGPRERYFKSAYWTNSPASFVSETGVHGCPLLESLRKMMGADGLYPWPDKTDKMVFNRKWCCKSVVPYPEMEQQLGSKRNALMVKQVQCFFASCPDDLGTFVDASQIYQAEALRCWAGTFRCRQGRTWGMLWWNLRDGWPVISDALVDYYGGRKRAYEVLKLVSQPQLVQLCDGAVRGLMAVNGRLYPVKGRVVAKDVESDRVLFDQHVELPANAAIRIADLKVPSGQGVVAIRYDFEGFPLENRCLYGEPPFDYQRYQDWMTK